MTRLREEFAFQMYRAAAAAARTLPAGAASRLFDLVGRSAHRLMPTLRDTVAGNQAQVLGLEVDHPTVLASTREAFRSYARYWVDTFRLAQLTDDEVRARTEIVGWEHVEGSLAAGSGMLAILPHLGNWDLGGRYMSVAGIDVVSVAEELKPPRLYELFVAQREAVGMQILPMGGNGNTGRQLARALGENRVVALVADRDLTGRGIEVEMFGRQRTLPAGPALLALTTGAPLLVTPVYQTDRGWRIVFGAPLRIEPTGDRRRDAVTLTRRLAAEFERAIAVAPHDWHVFQPGWEP